MGTKIHQTAVVDSSAEIADGVEIGPYCVVGPKVKIGEGTVLHANAQIMKLSTLGKGNQIYPGAIIGGAPQDVGYKDEDTEVIIGDNNIIREFVTINRATTKQDGKTIVGNNNMLMAYVHLAHDVVVGNHVVLANLTQVAGHVNIEDYVFSSSGAMLHQFCRIGTRCFLAPMSMVNSDCVPGIMYFGHPAVPRSLNLVGLKRAGYEKDDLRAIKNAFKLLCHSDINRKDAIAQIKEGELINVPFVKCMVEHAEISLASQKGRSIHL